MAASRQSSRTGDEGECAALLKVPGRERGQPSFGENDPSTGVTKISGISDNDVSMKKGYEDPERDEEVDDDDEDIVPDGGWGWIVCFASFMVNFILDGTLFSFGILMLELLDDLGEDKSTTSWIGSAQMGIHMTMGPVISALLKRYSIRQVTIAGSLLAAMGFVASVFAPNVYVLIITYGVVGGVGFGMIFLPAIITVGLYFNKKRAIATGIATSGSGLGTFAYAYITNSLLSYFSWRDTILILGGILLNCLVCGMLFRPLVAKRVKKTKLSRNASFAVQAVTKTPEDDHSASSGYSSDPAIVASVKGAEIINKADEGLDNNNQSGHATKEFLNTANTDPVNESSHPNLAAAENSPVMKTSVVDSIDGHPVEGKVNSVHVGQDKTVIDSNSTQPSITVTSPINSSLSSFTGDNLSHSGNICLSDQKTPQSGQDNIASGQRNDLSKSTNNLQNKCVNSTALSVNSQCKPTSKSHHNINNNEYHQLTTHQNHNGGGNLTSHPVIKVKKSEDDAVSSQLSITSPSETTQSPSSWFYKDGPKVSRPGHLGRLYKSVDHLHNVDRNANNNTRGPMMNSEYKLNDFMGSQAVSLYGLKSYVGPHGSSHGHHHGGLRPNQHNQICKGLMRPILRKDIYYSGSVNHLPAYQHLGSMTTFMAAMTRSSSEDNNDVISAKDTGSTCCQRLNKWFPVRLLTNKQFVLLLITFTMWTAQSVSLTYLPDLAVSLGIARSHAAFLISIVGIANVLGRLIAGFITDCFRIPSIWLYFVALFVACVINFLIPFCGSYLLLQICSAIFGLCMAVAVSMRTIVLAEQLGIEALTESFGVVALFQGIAFTINPPIAGKLIDDFHSFIPPFIMSGTMYAMSAGATLWVACLSRPRSLGKEEVVEITIEALDSETVEDDRLTNGEERPVYV